MDKTISFTRTPLAILVASTLGGISLNATAEELDTLQVWGTQVTSDNSLLTEEIETKQATHLSGLLRDQAGVDVGGTHSTQQKITIRGLDDSDLNVTTDGVTQNNNIFHHVGNLLIAPDILKKVDIQVGTNSVLSGGLGGSVAFETKDAQELLAPGQRSGARLHTGYASNDSLGSSVTAYSQLTEEVDALVYYSYTDKENPDDGNGTELNKYAGITQNAMLKLGWDVNDKNRLEFKYDKYLDEGYYDLRTNLGSLVNSGLGNSLPADTKYSRQTTLLAHEYDGHDTFVKTTVYNTQLSHERNNDGDPALSEHNGLNSLAETKFENQEVRYGIEFDALEAGKEAAKDNVTKYAIYAEDEIALNSKFFLTPGIRFDSHKVDYTGQFEKTYTEVTYGLAGKYLLTDQWTLKASATTLFEGPAAREAFNASAGTVSSDLKAETGLNSEIGVAFQEQDFIGLDEFGFSVTVFQTDINDAISDRSTMRGMDNAGDYQLTGFEAKLTGRIGDTSARLTYAHSDDDSDELGNEEGDNIVLGVSTMFPEANVSLNWTSMVTLSTWDYSSRSSSFYKKDSFNVHNVSATWNPEQVENLTVTAGIDNIFDKAYASHSSDSTTDYEPGRNIKVSASYTF